MGKVAVTFRVMPKNADVDVAGLTVAVREALGPGVKDVAERPIAFGLKAVDATVVMDDAGGAAEAAESRLRGLAGVGEVETLGMSLL